MKILLDMSSIMWTALMAGKDVEGREAILENGKTRWVNTAAYGYENAVNMIVKTLEEMDEVPKNLIMVFEGKDSKSRRKMIEPSYKGQDSKIPDQYIEFNKMKEQVKTVFRNVGAIAVYQDFVEGDDVLAYIALNLEEDCVIQTGDNDLAVLNGKNPKGHSITVRVSGEYARNKYGDFDFKLITLYKSLVGDTSDNIKGVPGFGPKAFLSLVGSYGEEGCFELLGLIREGRRDDLSKIAQDNNCKLLGKIVDNWDSAMKSYRLALLHPEWVNTVRQALVWEPGMVSPEAEDERLVKWKAQSRLVNQGNYEKAFAFFQSQIGATDYFTIDFETSTPDESDEWLEAKDKDGIDVIGSYIVSMGLTFGANDQYGYYITTGHAGEGNVSMEELFAFLECIPSDKRIIAHNAAGFELPVAYNNYLMKNGWRGFIPNMVDTRIAASFWDENQPTHGLKALSKLLLNYDQETYEEVTTIYGIQYKMHELTAEHVLSYGLDDVYTTSALWNFFELFMQIDSTLEAFYRLEQKPMYLSALAYVQGVRVDVPRLSKLAKEDEKLLAECWDKLEAFLIEKGWDGVTCPVFDELTPASIKEALRIVTGVELETMVRKLDKLAILVEEHSPEIAQFVRDERLDLLNEYVARQHEGKPNFNVRSPKQISNLLYDVIGMPIRLRNKPTDKMRSEGKREGTPRTNEAAIEMAIKFGDVEESEATVLKALLEIKSCNTRNGLYWSAYPKMLHWKTGRLHPELRQSSTNTRRWAASNPNINQQERSPDGVRSVILPEVGHVFVSLDESSQEVRQLADYSKDENLLGCYIGESLRDTHSIVGARVAKVSYEEFMRMRKDPTTAKKAKGIRDVSKVVLFGTLYGAAAAKIAETLGITEKEAQTYIDAIFAEFPKVKEWKDGTENFAKENGYVEIASGTRRHLAKLLNSDNKFEASKALRQAGNARIQSAGANQIKTVMSAIWDSDLLESADFKWKFPCHDEICFSVAPKDATNTIETIHKFMVAQFLEVVPSESSVGIGLNYGQLVELEDAFADAQVRFSREIVEETVTKLMS